MTPNQEYMMKRKATLPMPDFVTVSWGDPNKTTQSYPHCRTFWLALVTGFNGNHQPILRNPSIGTNPHVSVRPGSVVAYGILDPTDNEHLPMEYGLVRWQASEYKSENSKSSLGYPITNNAARWWTWLGANYWQTWRNSAFDTLMQYEAAGCPGWSGRPACGNTFPAAAFAAGSWPSGSDNPYYYQQDGEHFEPAMGDTVRRFIKKHLHSTNSEDGTLPGIEIQRKRQANERRQILADQYSIVAGRRARQARLQNEAIS